MRRMLLAVAGMLGLMTSLLAGSPAAADVPEVVFSSDFEDGTTQGWFRRGTAVLAASDAQAHGGSYSLLTTGRTAGWHGPAVDLLGTLVPRAVYEVEAYVRLQEGSPTTQLQMTVQFVPESTGQTRWQQVASEPAVTDQSWTELRGQYSPPESGFELQLYIESPDPTVSYYVDDVTVTMIEPPPDSELPPEETGRVDFATKRQHIDGFGFSEAFGRAAVMNGSEGLTPENQRKVLDLLLNPETGAGFSILRLHIASTPEDSIQPQDPGGPDAEPRYEWDGYDMGQVWLAKHAMDYGLERFYADAWSAPGYMKTNGDEANGGMLCGVPGTDCDEDWRQAYANYLLQYVRFYADEGIRITDLGFTNEPDFTASYSSMRFDDAQIVDFVKAMGQAIDRSGLDLNLVCCDAAGWNRQVDYTRAIEADPQSAAWVDIHSGHSYVSRARSPLPTDDPVWMSEYALPSGTAWVEAWDGNPSAGLVLANDIHDTLTLAEANAYITWFGASVGFTAAPIQLDGPDFNVSSRLWATAAYSRFIRPGAFRVEAQTSGQLMKISAYENSDGSKVINVINNRESGVSLDLALHGVSSSSHVVTYLTDETHSLERMEESVTGSDLTVELPPRSLTTLVLHDCTTSIAGPRTGPLTVDSGVTCLAQGSRIAGPISVRSGGSLVAVDASVDGPVAASDAATVRLVGTTVRGPVRVSDVTERLLISQSEITGPVAVTGVQTGYAPVAISGNTIGGPLSCEDNSPSPVNEGKPNAVVGPTSGQCVGL
jgi:glucosylceramidase